MGSIWESENLGQLVDCSWFNNLLREHPLMSDSKDWHVCTNGIARRTTSTNTLQRSTSFCAGEVGLLNRLAPGAKQLLLQTCASSWSFFLTSIQMSSTTMKVFTTWSLGFWIGLFLVSHIYFLTFFVPWLLLKIACMGLCQAHGTRMINSVFQRLYAGDLWLRRSLGLEIAHGLLQFVRAYSFEAAFFYEQGLVKFGLYPKLHLLHEVWEQMVYESTQSDWIYNPIAETCSVDEDFVGRCAVLSRSVSPRLNSLRSLQRYLAQIQQSWQRWKNMMGSGCGCLRMVVPLKVVSGLFGASFANAWNLHLGWTCTCLRCQYMCMHVCYIYMCVFFIILAFLRDYLELPCRYVKNRSCT